MILFVYHSIANFDRPEDHNENKNLCFYCLA